MSADLREKSASIDGEESPIEPRRRLELLKDCRDVVLSHLTRFIAEALDRLSVELTITAMKEAGRETQQALLDALSLVRVHRNDIEYGFRQSVAEIFERRLFNEAHAEPAKEPDSDELALVSEEEIETRIALERLVRRSRGRLDPDEVLGIRARLAALLDREWFDEDDHPVSPSIVFEALQRSLDDLSPAVEVRSALLQAFEPHVTASLNDVYMTVNERLRSERVLPRIRPPSVAPVPESGRGAFATSGQSTNIGPAGAVAGAGAVGGPVGSGAGAFGSGAPGHPPAGGGAGAMSARQGSSFAAGDAMSAQGSPGFGGNAMFGQYASPGFGVDPMSAGQVGMPATGIDGAGDPFAELMQRIAMDQPAARQSAARILADPGTFGMADLPMPAVEAPLIQALHTMQSAPAPAPGAPGGGQALAAQLLDEARSKGSSLDQLTVEIVSLVFDYIYNDRRLPDVVKQQLLRLQVVAVKAALIDRSFFARRQHPMRRLIDRISDLATDPDADLDDDSSLAAGIAEIVDWILVNFDDDLATFEDAMKRIDHLSHAEAERRATRLAELTKAAERLDALGVAEEEASTEIAVRIDAVTPAFVREFLYHTWTRALAHARVDGTCGGADWAASLHTAELLIWSVAPKAPDDIARLASLLPRLIGALVKGLQGIGLEQSLRERFLNELLQWHTRAIQDAKLNTARTVTGTPGGGVRMNEDGTLRFDAPRPGETRPGARPASHGSRTLENPSVDALERGAMLSIDEDDGTNNTFRLAWISPTRKLYVLTRFPDVGRSYSRSELITLFASGRARQVEAHRTVDLAIDAIARPETIPS